jgi:penicillin amidase
MNAARTIMRAALGSRLATTDGTIDVPGITDPVRIGRDAFGIPHIEAGSEDDAWYGLGFCHGQDRAFQLESLVRVIRGTLSELIGLDGIVVDRLSRRIGFARSAQEQIAAVSDEVRAMGEAYARGVTAGATVGVPKPAHEFTLLQASPTPYAATDVLGMLKLMSFLLASNWDSELVRYKIFLEDGEDALAALDPTYPEWLPVTAPPGTVATTVIDHLSEDLATFNTIAGGGGGSNNWAIAGSKTASGRPIVANDPHLAPSHPSHWYLAHISTPEWSVAGATFVGVPGMPVGFNGHGAWGVTAGLVDNTDLFIEEIGDDGKSVRSNDGFVACEVRNETINVKGGDPVVEQVLETPRGPIVGPALAGEVGAISMRAVWLDPRPIEGFLVVHRAADFAGLRSSFAAWPGLPLNIVFGDDRGEIGWQLVGEAPVRRQGWGTFPLPGWAADAGWQDRTFSVQRLPSVLNPDTGYVATANNKPVADDDGHPFIGFDFIDGYRLARIDEMLSARDDWTLESVGELQMDRTPIPWREMREIVLEAPTDNNDTRRALELLRTWDGVASPESSAATIYEFFVVEMAQQIVLAKAPNSARWALAKGFSPLSAETMLFARRTGHLVDLLRRQPAGWFDRSWPEEIAASLAAALRRVEVRYGSDPTAWQWGSVRPLTFKHPAGERKPMDQVFNLGPFPWGGDANTLNQAAVSFLDPAANSGFVASMRMAVDVGNWDENRFILPGGQSGNPLSPHYDDQLDRYREGGAIAIAWSKEAVNQAVQTKLELRPS